MLKIQQLKMTLKSYYIWKGPNIGPLPRYDPTEPDKPQGFLCFFLQKLKIRYPNPKNF